MAIVFDTGALVRPAFDAADFRATKWDTAADKAAFANTLCRFISADFKQSLFTEKLYRRLSMTFGHIAHFERGCFFKYFFDDLQGKIEFLHQTVSRQCYGDAERTYCDVERAVIKRVRACNLLDAYRARRATEVEQVERELLRRLQQKYDGGSAPVTAASPIIHAGAGPVVATRRKTQDQQPSLL